MFLPMHVFVRIYVIQIVPAGQHPIHFPINTHGYVLHTCLFSFSFFFYKFITQFIYEPKNYPVF